MPVVFRSGDLTFFFYSNEGNPREPVHIHVRKAGAVINNRNLIKSTWNDYFGN